MFLQVRYPCTHDLFYDHFVLEMFCTNSRSVERSHVRIAEVTPQSQE